MDAKKKVFIAAAALIATTGMAGCANNAQSSTEPNTADPNRNNQYGQATAAPCKAQNSEGCSSQHSCIGTCIREDVGASTGIEPENARLDKASDCPCGPDQKELDKVYAEAHNIYQNNLKSK